MTADGIVHGLAGFLIYAGAVAIPLRLRLDPTAVVMGVIPVAWVGALAVLLGAGHKVNFWVFSAGYCFFVLGFLMAFGAIYKSISLRILLHLSRQPDHSDDFESLSRGTLDESFRNRLAIIEEKRYAVRQGNAFALTERGARIARSAGRLQRIFGIARSG